MRNQEIEKIFVINLEDKEHRWSKFRDINNKVERFEAIDSRKNHLICEDYGLKLAPVGLTNKLYTTFILLLWFHIVVRSQYKYLQYYRYYYVHMQY